MYRGSTVGVVVPTYNEAEFVDTVIETIPGFVDWLFVVDDCSTDDTWTTIRAHADAAGTEVPERRAEVVAAVDGEGRSMSDGGEVAPPQVVPVRHRTNRGRGGAVKTGYRLAMRYDVDVVAVMDGDGQMDPEYLDDLLDPVVDGEADYAKGNRLDDPSDYEEMSRWRLFGNVLLTYLTKVASGYYGMRDPQNGYTAVSVEALRDISLDQLFDGYGFLNDMLVRLGANDKRVVDVPVRAIYDDEESGIRYRTFVPMLSWLLLRMYVWRLWMSYGPGDPGASSGRDEMASASRK